jgi:hypothetical protein
VVNIQHFVLTTAGLMKISPTIFLGGGTTPLMDGRDPLLQYEGEKEVKEEHLITQAGYI